MVYLIKTEIPDNKKVTIALKQVFGIGSKTNITICKSLGITKKTRVKDLTNKLKLSISKFINANYTVGQNLKQKIKETIRKRLNSKDQKAIRLKNGFPIRGQRTHTNAKTTKTLSSKLIL